MAQTQQKPLPEVIQSVDGQPPVVLDEFEDMDGGGLQNISIEQLQTPILYLLQAGSKAVMEGAPEYVDGARPGMFYNNASHRIYDGKKGIDIIPCRIEHVFNEWIPIEPGSQGGFRGSYGRNDRIVERLLEEQGRFKKLDTGNDTELVETHTLYALIGEPGFSVEDCERVIIPFTSIKIKPFKAMTTKLNELRYRTPDGTVLTPSIYQHRWRMTSVFESKWKPNGAQNVQIVLAGKNQYQALLRKSDPVYDLAKEFYMLCEAGEVKADYSRAEYEGDIEASNTATTDQRYALGEEPPF